MVKGKPLQEELAAIEDFFNDLSAEEFDKMLIECGADVPGSQNNITNSQN